MKASRLFFWLLVGVTQCACASKSYPPDPERNPAAVDAPVLRIGLISDSQFQTEKSLNGAFLMTGKLEDAVVPVAIRPAGLNKLSPDLLRYFAQKLVEKDVNVILYLGDLANNGCSDEIDDGLKVLREIRDGKLDDSAHRKVPVFVIPGNHDYLGGGNTPFMEDRMRLCDGSNTAGLKRNGDGLSYSAILPANMNMPLQKHEVMGLMDKFNKENELIKNDLIKNEWTFVSFDSNYHEALMKQRCAFNRAPGMAAADKFEHHKPGCYLTGILRYKRDTEITEIVLMDTSDYFDKTGSPAPDLMKRWYGLSGWISSYENGFLSTRCQQLANGDEVLNTVEECKKADRAPSPQHYGKDENAKEIPSQLEWIKDHIKGQPSPAVRYIASHYPINELGVVARMFSPWAGLPCKIADALATDTNHEARRLFWLSGHTHKQPSGERKLLNSEVCGTAEFGTPVGLETFTVGSTTDFDPNAAYVVTGRQYEHVMVTPLWFDPVQEKCGELFRVIEEGASECNEPQSICNIWQQPYIPIGFNPIGYTLFGLDAEYKRPGWKSMSTIAAISNLDILLSRLDKLETGLTINKIRQCLAYKASELECRNRGSDGRESDAECFATKSRNVARPETTKRAWRTYQ